MVGVLRCPIVARLRILREPNIRSWRRCINPEESTKSSMIHAGARFVVLYSTFGSLVFVHGLNSFSRDRHPYETWTHDNGVFWPTIFLAEDNPFARIFVYGYNSTVASAEHMSTARIRDHADTLLNLLDLRRSRQLVFPDRSTKLDQWYLTRCA